MSEYDRCARCGVKMIDMRAMTNDYRPLCDYCVLGMEPGSYLRVGAEETDHE